MLSKMGWEAGKGLGKDAQGRTDHVKVKLKGNNLGIVCALALSLSL
jgi:Pin2-interacting protein X1